MCVCERVEREQKEFWSFYYLVNNLIRIYQYENLKTTS